MDSLRWALWTDPERHRSHPPREAARVAFCAGASERELLIKALTVATAVARLRVQAALGPTFQVHLTGGWKALQARERYGVCELLRCVFGNPFRPVAAEPAWLSWNDGVAVRLAHGIYADRAFDRMAILADALEEAGCTNQEILTHLREPGPHVRGCWALDALRAGGLVS
jgi:hypothetical protein